MAKQRDWMDWLNTGANVLQTAQAVEIKGHLATLAKTEAQREQRATFHRLCRELLIQMDSKIDDLMASATDSPKSTYAAARMLKQQFEHQEFTPSLFDDWADIDRAKATISKLTSLLRKLADEVGEAWVKEVTTCLRWQADMPGLDELASQVEQVNNLGPEATELFALESQLKGTAIPKSYVEHEQKAKSTKPILGFCAVLCAALVIFPFAAKVDDDTVVLASVGSGLAILILPLVIFLGLKGRDPSDGSEEAEAYKTLLQKVERAREAVLMANVTMPSIDVARMTALMRKLGEDGADTDFLALRDERRKRVDALFALD
jgi:hypothetical protein